MASRTALRRAQSSSNFLRSPTGSCLFEDICFRSRGSALGVVRGAPGGSAALTSRARRGRSARLARALGDVPNKLKHKSAFSYPLHCADKAVAHCGCCEILTFETALFQYFHISGRCVWVLVIRVRSKHAALITYSAHIFYHLLSARPPSRLKHGASSARNPGPQVGALLGNRSADGRALHLTLHVHNHASVVLKVDEATAVHPPPRLALAHDNSGHHCAQGTPRRSAARALRAWERQLRRQHCARAHLNWDTPRVAERDPARVVRTAERAGTVSA